MGLSRIQLLVVILSSKVVFLVQGQSVCRDLENRDLPRFSLSQSDFDFGTKIISEPGIYTLASNISFNPNSAEALGVEPYYAGDVQPDQFQFYDRQAFGIGFFAAISLTTNDVVIDLNNFYIEQSKEHALHQRLFTIIELASAPFVNGQGPHFFGDSVFTANNVCIKNGILGRSSQKAIHGNDNTNIEIRNLTIFDFESIGIQLNFARDVLIENINIPSRPNYVPVRGRFSAARFIRPWIKKLVDEGYGGTLNIQGKLLSALDIQNALRNVINIATNQVLSLGNVQEDLVPLFAPPMYPYGRTDQDMRAGVVINFLGVASNGFPNNVPIEARSKRIVIRNFDMDPFAGFASEAPALTEVPPGGSDPYKRLPAIDAVGAVLETQDNFTITSDGVYVGNPVANAQLLVAKAQNENFGFNFGPEKKQITPKIVEWAESGLSYKDFGLTYICNGDFMFRVPKGTIGYKLDAVDDLVCDNCYIDYVSNSRGLGSTVCNDDIPYRDSVGKSNPFATLPGYNGGDGRGFSLSSSSNVLLKDCGVANVCLQQGSSIAYDIRHGSQQIDLIGSKVGDLSGAFLPQTFDNNPTPRKFQARLYQDDTVVGVTVIND